MDSRDMQLDPLDQQALDALVEAGFEAGGTPEAVRTRCQKIMSILGALDAPVPAGGAGLASRTMDGVVSRRGLTEDTLCEADGAALDALIEAQFDLSRVSETVRERAARLASMGESITRSAVAADRSPDLAERTFGLVMLAADRPLATLDSSRGAPWARWRDLVSAAAVLLVGASVVIPVMSASRQQQLRGECTANMASIASALSNYASANRDALPVASTSRGGVWCNVGTPAHSNSANLFTLARTGFAKVRDLACPGNANACRETMTPGAMDWRSIEDISYSYQVMFADQRPGTLDPSQTAVLADRSPVILRALAHEPVIPFENSPNHCRRGQSILFCDGSVAWRDVPELRRGDQTDNIWLPWAIEEILRRAGAGEPITLEGNEVPASDRDTFLAP